MRLSLCVERMAVAIPISDPEAYARQAVRPPPTDRLRMPITVDSAEPPYAGLHDPRSFRDACGTGFLARIDGVPSHELVEQAVAGVVSLTHRGAVNADPNTGDGAGVTIAIPDPVLQDDLARLGRPGLRGGDLGVAMVFLPVREAGRKRARKLLEAAASRTGLEVVGWRVVPTDPEVLGDWATQALPGIEQLLLAKPDGVPGDEFDRRLTWPVDGRKRNMRRCAAPTPTTPPPIPTSCRCRRAWSSTRG